MHEYIFSIKIQERLLLMDKLYLNATVRSMYDRLEPVRTTSLHRVIAK